MLIFWWFLFLQNENGLRVFKVLTLHSMCIWQLIAWLWFDQDCGYWDHWLRLIKRPALIAGLWQDTDFCLLPESWTAMLSTSLYKGHNIFAVVQNSGIWCKLGGESFPQYGRESHFLECCQWASSSQHLSRKNTFGSMSSIVRRQGRLLSSLEDTSSFVVFNTGCEKTIQKKF